MLFFVVFLLFVVCCLLYNVDMAKKSDNTYGNPYHDEATGQFTSAGVSAVKREVVHPSIDDRLERFKGDLQKAPGRTIEEKLSSFLTGASRQDIANIIDIFINSPSLMTKKKELCNKLFRSNLVENKNKKLDIIGVDYIAFDNVDDITSFDFIDLKTSSSGGVDINFFTTSSSGKYFFQDCLLNPYHKVNNKFVFQFMNFKNPASQKKIVTDFFLRSSDYNDFADKYINQETSSTHVIDSGELYKMVKSKIGRKMDLMNALFRDTQKAYEKGVSAQTFISKIFSNPFWTTKSVNGMFYADHDMGNGLVLTVSIKEGASDIPYYGIRSSLHINQGFIRENFPDSEI